MSRGHGQVRRSQVITTWGPGALIDLPRHAGIVGGLETWPSVAFLDEVVDKRLSRKLAQLTGLPNPRMYAPPPADTAPGEKPRGIGVWRFPEWFVVQEKPSGDEPVRSRRLVRRTELEKGKFEDLQVVPTRFVRACRRGHIDDINWRRFVHQPGDACRKQLWLDETGTGGDLADLTVRCECGERESLQKAAEAERNALGTCRGLRPWLGRDSKEECNLPSRLLIRTATNAYFPQVLSALSLPDEQGELQQIIDELWDFLSIVESPAELAFVKKQPKVAARLAGIPDDEVLEAIKRAKLGDEGERPVKQVELDAILAAPEGFGDDVPVDLDFHARKLPKEIWQHSSLSDPIEAVVQLHRLREVMALTGFTRFEAVSPDIDGEYESDVERADLAEDPQWFPAVENRGEGIFLALGGGAVAKWLKREGVVRRLRDLAAGHDRWAERRSTARPFPGGAYILLHTLSHLLIQSLAMRCGYPASSIRERIYVDHHGGRFGLMLFTASPDAEGTLGGLVGQARAIEEHLEVALRVGGLCANDPVCAQHTPAQGFEGRHLHGAACHGCALIAETSCEMRNDYLDRALVVPTLAVPDAAFFPALQ
jgi:hypothetical protein